MTTFRYGSHLPILIEAVLRTDGAILELGCGIYSTVFLHWFCYRSGRRLRTLESKRDFYRGYYSFKQPWHSIEYVKDWKTKDLSGDWSVVLVDQAPAETRGMTVLKVSDADYIVCHDTNIHDKAYGYDTALDKFKYRFDKKIGHIYTTVLSNKHNLENFI